MEEDGSTTSNDFASKLATNPSLWFVLIAGMLLVLLSAYYITGEIIFYVCGISILPIPRDDKENDSQHEISDQARQSLDLERVPDENVTREAVKALKQQRREKYLTFLSPYTKVIKESDLYFGIDKPTKRKEMIDTNDVESAFNSCEISEVEYDINSKSSDIDRDNNISKCRKIDSTHSLWIQVDILPLQEPYFVEGICSICLSEFDVGDTLVTSTRKVCSHCFHQECALTWLSSGKKRCPICRQFFVPGTRVDDQEVICHTQDDIEAYISPFKV